MEAVVLVDIAVVEVGDGIFHVLVLQNMHEANERCCMTVDFLPRPSLSCQALAIINTVPTSTSVN